MEIYDTPPLAPTSSARKPNKVLGVYFARCGAYGQLRRNAEGTAYVGMCPKCGSDVRIPIGDGGTSQRFFKVVCPKASPVGRDF